MLTVFFTIIFISEVIIASWLISYLRKFDKIVCETNDKVSFIQPVIKEKIELSRKVITLVMTSYEYFVEFVAKKKKQYTTSLTKNIITALLIMVLRIPGKNILQVIDFVLMVKNILKK